MLVKVHKIYFKFFLHFNSILVKSVEKILLVWYIVVFMFNNVFQSIINILVFPINSLVARNQVLVSSTVKRLL